MLYDVVILVVRPLCTLYPLSPLLVCIHTAPIAPLPLPYRSRIALTLPYRPYRIHRSTRSALPPSGCRSQRTSDRHRWRTGCAGCPTALLKRPQGLLAACPCVRSECLRNLRVLSDGMHSKVGGQRQAAKRVCGRLGGLMGGYFAR